MNGQIIRFGILEAIYWSIMGSFGAYVAAFCLNRGYEESIVSIMIGIYMICAFAGQFFWGSVCDKLRTNRKVFLFELVVAAVTQIGMYLVHGKIGFAILYGLFGFMLGPLGSILDTWMLRSLKYDMKKYGVSRSCGSAGFAIVVWITGNLIQRIGYQVMPVMATCFALLTFVIAYPMEDAPISAVDSQGGISFKDILSIMKIPSYVMLLAVVFLLGMSNAPVSNLKIMILQEVGGGVATQGLDSFAGCMVQFLIFLISGTLTFIPARMRMWGATVAISLAMLINFNATAIYQIIIGSMLLNIMYSLMISSSRELIFQIVEPKYQTTANGLSDAGYSFIAGTIAMMYSGMVAERFGVHVLVGMALASAVLSFGFMSFQIFFMKKRP